jgi:hypothetical protein
MWHVWKTGGLYPGFWLGDPREGDHLEDLIVDRIILEMNLTRSMMRSLGLV